MILYSLRLYVDFAGYSAIAIGISTWFVLPAMENFRQPYYSQSITEFWTRWHISLSSWLRDYLFFPLSRFLIARFGNKRSFPIQLFSLFVTMLATGIWHGSSLTFVVWGALHGLYVTAERLIGRLQPRSQDDNGWIKRVKTLADILATQLLVAIGWVFFRANSLSDGIEFVRHLFMPGYAIPGSWWIRVLTSLSILVIFDGLLLKGAGAMAFWELRLPMRVGLLVGLLLVLIIYSGAVHAPFVYAGF
jgi:D-alanyl-lipoteichoic acid acyltransferase DltB (MBOAT superfamily)